MTVFILVPPTTPFAPHVSQRNIDYRYFPKDPSDGPERSFREEGSFHASLR